MLTSSSGMFVNLSAVMLRLCEPFLDANASKRDRFDPDYVLYSKVFDLKYVSLNKFLYPFVASITCIDI